MDSPVISIIVPVYHVEKYLRRCLDSILGQTFRDFELILVNDGGNEEETGICEEYAARDPRIRYVRQENRGLSAARNLGLSLASGKWLMFADSDDWVHPEFCAAALDMVEGTDAAMGIFDLVCTRGDETTGYVDRSRIEEGIHDSLTILRLRLSGKIPGFVWNKIYLRSLWDGIRFPVGENWEDEAVIHILIDRAGKIAISHRALYYKMGRSDCITSLAYASGESAKWYFLQRSKRYVYIREHHPELLDIEGPIVSKAAVYYIMYCLRPPEDSAEFYRVRSWIMENRASSRGAGAKHRAALWMIRRMPRTFMSLCRRYLRRSGDRENGNPFISRKEGACHGRDHTSRHG